MKRNVLILMALFAVVALLAVANWLINLLAASAPVVVLVVGLPALIAIGTKVVLAEVDR
jgi:hypothetical protein